MKKLTQDIFIGQPEWVKSASIDSDGWAYFYEESSGKLRLGDMDYNVSYSGSRVKLLGYGYDATDWQNSAIDREVAK